jgi:hypothetical protein
MLCDLVNRAAAVHTVLSGMGGSPSIEQAGKSLATYLQSGALVASAG